MSFLASKITFLNIIRFDLNPVVQTQNNGYSNNDKMIYEETC